MQTQQSGQLYGPFLIQTSIDDGDPVDYRDVCRLIRRLGGVETDDGFAFPSAVQRAVAWEILGEKYGTRYITAVRREGDANGGDA